MAVPDLIFRQKQQTQKTAMNTPTMLADFLDLVTPNLLNKHLQKSVSASFESLLTSGQCSVTAIDGALKVMHKKSTVLNAPIGYSATALCIRPCLFYASMTGGIVKGKQALILGDWSDADKERRHFILRASLAV